MILSNEEIVKLAKIIEDIDGGCGPCINSFMGEFKELVSDKVFKDICKNIEVYGEPFVYEEYQCSEVVG